MTVGIHCLGVGKRFGEGARAFEAVRGVGFDVPGGEFVSIVGPSGCGKSTLLMMVGGLEPLTAGRIDFGDSPVTGPRSEAGVSPSYPEGYRPLRWRERYV